MGAPYIYDISRLRVNRLSSSAKQAKQFRILKENKIHALYYIFPYKHLETTNVVI